LRVEGAGSGIYGAGSWDLFAPDAHAGPGARLVCPSRADCAWPAVKAFVPGQGSRVSNLVERVSLISPSVRFSLVVGCLAFMVYCLTHKLLS